MSSGHASLSAFPILVYRYSGQSGSGPLFCATHDCTLNFTCWRPESSGFIVIYKQDAGKLGSARSSRSERIQAFPLAPYRFSFPSPYLDLGLYMTSRDPLLCHFRPPDPPQTFQIPSRSSPDQDPDPHQIKPQILHRTDFDPFRIGGSDISENPAAIYSESERPNRLSVLKADVEGAQEGRNGRREGGKQQEKKKDLSGQTQSEGSLREQRLKRPRNKRRPHTS